MTHSVQRLMPIVCLALFTLPFSASADADEASLPSYASAPASSLSASATLSSQYVWRGWRQTDGKPAVQAGVDYLHPSGWSAGVSVANVSDRYAHKGSVEWDVVGGYSGVLGELGYSLMGHYLAYPGAARGADGAGFNYGEVSAGIRYKALYAKYNYTVTRSILGLAHARGTGYLDGGANVDLGNATTLNLHAGEGRVAGAGNDYWNWRDVKVGLTRRLAGGWKVSGAYTRAFGASHAYERYTTGTPNRSGPIGYASPGKNNLVVSLSRRF